MAGSTINQMPAINATPKWIPPPIALETFVYAGDENEFENLLRYTKNGYHPVILGDVLLKPQTCVSDENMQPRYRILLKLGFGAFGTVWLARDLVEERNISIKIRSGSATPCPSTEGRVLRWVRDNGLGCRGHDRILHFYDSFIIQGPNGFHECLVTEVVAPICELIWDRTASRFMIQLIGDPHTGNFGIAVPHLHQLDEEIIIDFISNPEVMPVVPHDPQFPMHTIPAYQTPTTDITKLLAEEKALPTTAEANIKILDFGRAHWVDEPLPELHGAVPAQIRPPEVEVYRRSAGKEGSAWSEAADVWAFALSLCELRLEPLISRWDDTLRSAIKFGGPAPRSWLQYCNEGTDVSLRTRDEVWSRRVKLFSKSPKDMDSLLNVVKLMVVTAPNDRCSMADVLSYLCP
ncbi:SRSF protein kinase 3 [Tolypocladium ophioglossoides CBS 100239]|uniref:non-specific serine/threonine protein kinase n=1 Tax=Tolypocladium ophioglossoides (strain CBS 100239) TaxID=1163406 RepID=A0A0L0NAW8_TOLOC|nr:SRSF protein kinase 3 [Tolypocladium ophioglossoides CBS 100239]